MSQQVKVDVTLTLEDGPINASAMRESVRFFLQDARRDGQITPEDDQEHATLTDLKVELIQPGLETPRMLVLSTAHITSETNGLFQMMTDDVPLFFTKDTRGDPGDNAGWIIPIVGDEPFPHTCPTDLVAIRQLAEANGCTWIMLDRDGPVVPSLPTYQW